MKRSGHDIQNNPYLAMMQLQRHRIVLFRDGRVLIHGTKDVTEARSIYQRYFG
jgi:adenylyltransferase/sulfurtransferase